MSESEEREEQEGREDGEDRKNHGEALTGGRGRGRGEEGDLDELDPSLSPFKLPLVLPISTELVCLSDQPTLFPFPISRHSARQSLKAIFIKYKVLQKISNTSCHLY